MSWGEFFGMGGYAVYVWASYLLAAAILIANVAIPLARHRGLRRGAQGRARRRI